MKNRTQRLQPIYPLIMCMIVNCLMVMPSHAQVQQHALVVGINHYQHADGTNLTNLMGAVNDAKLIYSTLRDSHVQGELLLNASATKANFLRAWQTMVANAQHGDTLIMTFAGHGSQIQDQKPLDEKDGHDETLVFHDYDASQGTGLLYDDELYGLFKQAHAYNILVLIDACHSAGMIRSLKYTHLLGRARYTPPPLPIKRLQRNLTLPLIADNITSLPHVTLITAVDNESLVVNEIMINNKPHGALSWYFANAVRGSADKNANQTLERDELKHFLHKKIRQLTNNRQTPQLLPRADAVSVVALPQLDTERPVASTLDEAETDIITLLTDYSPRPESLQYVRWVTQPPFDLYFKARSQSGVEVLNRTGDQITGLTESTTALWQRIVDKHRLLDFLHTYAMRSDDIQLTLAQGDKLHYYGEVLNFTIDATDKRFNALTLFNLSGNGELQFLYPYPADKPTVGLPYHMNPVQVDAPFGSDSLIAVLCQHIPTSLHLTLAELQPELPDLAELKLLLTANACQVAEYAFFTEQ